MNESDASLVPSRHSRFSSTIQKRNIYICAVISVVVTLTVVFTVTIFATGVHFLTTEELEDIIKEQEKRNTTPPNVLFIMADDLRPTLNCYGDNLAVTPNIDQIASSGHTFTKAYAQQALCAPSRTSLLTSRRPDTLHVYGNDKSYQYWRNSVGNFTTLPQYFKENGYHTSSFGKIFHDGMVSNRSDDYPYSWSETPYHPPTKKFKMDKVCPSSDGKKHMNLFCPVDVNTQPGGSLPDIEITKAAIEFLENYSDLRKPFFLGVGYYKPHIPLKFPKEYLDLYPLERIHLAPNRELPEKLPCVAWNPWTDIRLREDVADLNLTFPYAYVPDDFQKLIRQGYYASVSYIDDLIGDLLGKLEDMGLAKNTIIVFLGDHGWSLGEHQEWSKYSNYDVSLRVPLIFNLPKSAHRKPFQKITSFDYVPKPGTPNVINIPVELVDLFPTLADLTRLPKVPSCTNETSVTLCTEGLSFNPLLVDSHQEKESWAKTTVFSQQPRPKDYPQNNSDQPTLQEIKIMGYTMRDDRYRYTEWVSFNHETFKANWSEVIAEELYDHEVDPLEDNNIANVTQFSDLAQFSQKLKEGFGQLHIKS